MCVAQVNDRSRAACVVGARDRIASVSATLRRPMTRRHLSFVPVLLFSTLLPTSASAQKKGAVASLDDVTNEAREPEQVALLRPAGRYADLPEAGFDPASLLTGGGGQAKAFFPLLEMVDDLAVQPGKEALLDANKKALALGRDWASQNLDPDMCKLQVKPADKVGDKIFAEGNAAAALNYMRASSRDSDHPETGGQHIGFRCASDLNN